MSLYRVIFVALATLFSIGMTSMASANCCGGGWGYSAPLAYGTVAPVGYGGCGGCGAPTAAAVYAAPVAPAPIAVAPSPIYLNNALPTAFGGPCCGMGGCGDCLTYAPVSGCGSCGAGGWGGGPVAFGGGCGSCGATSYGGCGNCGAVAYGGCGGCGASVGYTVATPSLYIANQGPVYSGPGLSVPYSTYSPEMAYAPASDYPYAPGAGYAAPPPYPNTYGRPYYPRYARPYYRPYARPYLRPRFYGRPYVRPYRYGYRPYRPVARAAAYGHFRRYP